MRTRNTSAHLHKPCQSGTSIIPAYDTFRCSIDTLLVYIQAYYMYYECFEQLTPFSFHLAHKTSSRAETTCLSRVPQMFQWFCFLTDPPFSGSESSSVYGSLLPEKFPPLMLLLKWPKVRQNMEIWRVPFSTSRLQCLGFPGSLSQASRRGSFWYKWTTPQS